MKYGVELYVFTSLKESVGSVNLGAMRGQVSICTIRIRIWSGARKNCTKTDSTWTSLCCERSHCSRVYVQVCSVAIVSNALGPGRTWELE